MSFSPRPVRILELDGLRALAVLAVIAFHYSIGTALANRAAGLGWCGVGLFFVLSGYLITSILLGSRARPGYFTTFYARRTLRIFPLYFLLLGVYALASRAFGGPQPWSYWGMHAAFLSSTLEYFHYWPFAAPAFVYAGVTVLWSLSIEEQFYLIWAPVVRWLRPAGLWIFLALVVAGAPVLRFAIHTRAFPEYRFFPARLDSLAWGAVLALAATGGRGWLGPRRLLGLGAAALAGLALLLATTGAARESRAFGTLGYTLFAVLFAAVVGWAVARAGSPAPACRLLRCSPLRCLGQISYAVYLVHYPILLAVGDALTPRLGTGAFGIAIRDGVALAATLLVAAASWRWLEAPILALKERWAPARGKRPEPIPPALRTPGVAAGLE